MKKLSLLFVFAGLFLLSNTSLLAQKEMCKSLSSAACVKAKTTANMPCSKEATAKCKAKTVSYTSQENIACGTPVKQCSPIKTQAVKVANVEKNDPKKACCALAEKYPFLDVFTSAPAANCSPKKVANTNCNEANTQVALREE